MNLTDQQVWMNVRSNADGELEGEMVVEKIGHRSQDCRQHRATLSVVVHVLCSTRYDGWDGRLRRTHGSRLATTWR